MDRAIDFHDADVPGWRECQDGSCEISYYTLHPAPTQWVAVGVAPRVPVDRIGPGRLFVGTASTEADAISDLCERLTREWCTREVAPRACDVADV